jgi:hypothetical protein
LWILFTLKFFSFCCVREFAGNMTCAPWVPLRRFCTGIFIFCTKHLSLAICFTFVMIEGRFKEAWGVVSQTAPPAEFLFYFFFCSFSLTESPLNI